MAKKSSGDVGSSRCDDRTVQRAVSTKPQKPSALLDIRVIYCGDNLEQLAKLPDACNSALRTPHSAIAVAGSFYYHYDWHTNHVLFGDECMAVLGRFTAADVPAVGSAETESPVGKYLDFSAEELAQIEKLLPG
jgi:hypothetical protein